MEARYFRTPAEFRRWLHMHHAKETELWVGFHKVGSGEASITWPQSVDEALCYGWIDGRRQRIDEARYRIRFSPRKAGSIWSAVNIRRMAELGKAGLVQPAGAQAFAALRADRSGVYSHERRPENLDSPNASYRRACCNWVNGAKQEATRQRRNDSLIEHCARGAQLAQFTRR